MTPAKSVIWTKEEVAEGILEGTSQSDTVGIFERISTSADPEGYKQRAVV